MAICVSIVTSLENGMDLAEMSNIYGGPGFLGEYNSALLSFPFEIYKERLSAFVTAKCSFNHKKKLDRRQTIPCMSPPTFIFSCLQRELRDSKH